MDVRKSGDDPAAGSLSGGNLQKFIVGRELDRQPAVLVVNQPTWGVDAGAASRIRQALVDLAKAGSAVVVISQDLDEIFEVATDIAVICEGRLSHPFPAGELTRERIGLLMGGLHESSSVPEAPHVEEAVKERSHAAGEVRYRFSGYGKRGKVKPFDLEVRAGEVVGIAGLLGSGRTETAELLFGIEHADSGSATIDGQPVTLSHHGSQIEIGFPWRSSRSSST